MPVLAPAVLAPSRCCLSHLAGPSDLDGQRSGGLEGGTADGWSCPGRADLEGRGLGADEARGPAEKRPYLATECHDVVEADRWRGQVIRDIGRQVMAIQNAGLGEHKCVPPPSPGSDAEQRAARRAHAARPRSCVPGRRKQ